MPTKQIREIPVVGRKVKVVTDNYAYPYFQNFINKPQRTNTYTGRVAPTEEGDMPGSFRLHTDNPWYPVREILLDHVLELKYLGRAPKKVQKEKIRQVQVLSSKGDKYYTVTLGENSAHCTCIGYHYYSRCRHITIAKEQSNARKR